MYSTEGQAVGRMWKVLLDSTLCLGKEYDHSGTDSPKG